MGIEFNGKLHAYYVWAPGFNLQLRKRREREKGGGRGSQSVVNKSIKPQKISCIGYGMFLSRHKTLKDVEKWKGPRDARKSS